NPFVAARTNRGAVSGVARAGHEDVVREPLDMSQRTNASSALPNTEQSWDAHWRRDGRAALEELGVSQVMDQIKFNYLMPFLPQHGLFVEFGCGSARLARFIIRRGLRGIGLDRSHEALLVAQKARRKQDSGRPVGL